MKITFEEITRRGSWAGWAILEAMTGKELGTQEEKSLDVVMTINGVEVDFRSVMTRIGENCDVAIGNKAKEIVNDLFDNMLGNLQNLLNTKA